MRQGHYRRRHTTRLTLCRKASTSLARSCETFTRLNSRDCARPSRPSLPGSYTASTTGAVGNRVAFPGGSNPCNGVLDNRRSLDGSLGKMRFVRHNSGEPSNQCRFAILRGSPASNTLPPRYGDLHNLSGARTIRKMLAHSPDTVPISARRPVGHALLAGTARRAARPLVCCPIAWQCGCRARHAAERFAAAVTRRNERETTRAPARERWRRTAIGGSGSVAYGKTDNDA